MWVAGTRGEVTLPDPDGSTVVGHVSTSGAWKDLGAAGLPKWLNVASLRVDGHRLMLTGMRPTPDGSSLRPFAATKPLWASTSARWTSQPVDAPAWDSSMGFPLLRIAAGAATWATAGSWLLRRHGSGWKVVDGPTFGTPLSACASAQGVIHLVSDTPGGSVLWRRSGGASPGGWTTVAVPGGFGAQRMTGDRNQLWVVGQLEGGEDYAAAALRVIDGRVVGSIGGPLSAGGQVGILDEVVIDTRGPIAAGYRATKPGGDAIGWTCRPVL